MQRMMQKLVEKSDDTIYVTINGKLFYVFNKEQRDHLLSLSWMKNESDKFEWITDDLYLYVDFSRLHLYDAINIGTYDFGVPQDWFEKNLEEIKSKGGVVWYYAEKDYFGKPYFDDNAMARLKTLIREALSENES